MKAGTKFSYRRVLCKYCGKWVAENWIIRHVCTVERNELRKKWLRERLDEDGYLD